MTIIINGYVTRIKARAGHSGANTPKKKQGKIFRDWWFGQKQIKFYSIYLPKEYWGKKIRLKVEIMEDKK